jgi:hypothetical protein
MRQLIFIYAKKFNKMRIAMNEKKKKYSGIMISEKPEIVREVEMKENSM